MELQQLDSLRRWFDGYVDGFTCGDPHVDLHLQFKYDHSLRTQAEIRALARDLRLGASHGVLAEAIGLLHDVGRFAQFTRYRTYDDRISIDHSVLGAEVLRRSHALTGLPAQERSWIETAVLHHSRRELPPDLDPQTLCFCRLIRDADKLEIFHIVAHAYGQLAMDPKGMPFQLDRPDEPGCNPEVIEATIQGRRVDNRDAHTLNDIKIIQLGWVHDINFPAALRRIREQRYLEQILDTLPEGPDRRRVGDAVLAYTRARLEQDRAEP